MSAAPVATSPALDALSSGAFATEANDRARICLVGADARAFVHRLSTNHVHDLRPGDARLNVLPTDKGRIVDLVLHLDRGERGVMLLGSAERGPTLLAWLDRYLFSEKVELTDASSTGSAAELFGARAATLVEEFVPGAARLPPWGFVEGGGRIIARSFDAVDGAGHSWPSFIVVDLERADVLDALVALGAVRGERSDAESVRIAAGAPGLPGELVDRFNPLDLGLHDAIHWAKGCYIGQEVIARLDTYQKQSKRLVGLVLGDADRAQLAPGAQVLVDGVVVGELTSVAPTSLGRMPNALAVARLKDVDDKAVQLKMGELVVDATAREPATAQMPHP